MVDPQAINFREVRGVEERIKVQPEYENGKRRYWVGYFFKKRLGTE